MFAERCEDQEAIQRKEITLVDIVCKICGDISRMGF